MAGGQRARRILAAASIILQGTGALAGAAEEDAGVAAPADPVLVGAGGIASCDTAGDEATAALIEELPEATVFTAGDNAYEKGTAAQFAKCYDKTWGRFKDRTRPAPGNHDYSTDSAGPYYDYFGDRAGKKGQGWYSYDLGEWHIVVLNSLCSRNSRCAPGSSQVQWLEADLAASSAHCTAAVIHHPLFSSDNVDGNRPEVKPLWETLYAAGADLVISGHARVYERFAPQTPGGRADQQYGLPLFNVGTGGRGHANFVNPAKKNSLVRNNTSWGVLKLTLHERSFDYAFLPVLGGTFRDSGTGACHGKPAGGANEPDGGTPSDASFSFPAEADASVIKKSPRTNYGNRSTVLADADPATGAYLRFTVSNLQGTVERATLRLWVTNGSGNGPAVYRTTASFDRDGPPWPESAMTWRRRPARTGGALDDLGAVAPGRFVEFDVTDAVDGNGLFSFELVAGSKDGTDFASSEATNRDRRPKLIVDVTLPPPALSR